MTDLGMYNKDSHFYSFLLERKMINEDYSYPIFPEMDETGINCERMSQEIEEIKSMAGDEDMSSKKQVKELERTIKELKSLLRKEKKESIEHKSKGAKELSQIALDIKT